MLLKLVQKIIFNDFLTTLEEDKLSLENSLVSQLPLFKEGLKAKLSSI